MVGYICARSYRKSGGQAHGKWVLNECWIELAVHELNVLKGVRRGNTGGVSTMSLCGKFSLGDKESEM